MRVSYLRYPLFQVLLDEGSGSMYTEILELFEGVSNAALTAYIHDPYMDNKIIGSRPAVIICPGGAYLGITEKEAEPVALRFMAAGYHAFVLRYSIGAGIARFPAPFVDTAKAILMIRENADKWGVDTDKIYLCGFSAGGHVAAMLSATWQEQYLARALNVDNRLIKPNGLILGYPLLDLYHFKLKNQERSLEMQSLLEMMFNAAYGVSDPDKSTMDEWNCLNRVTSNMPPAFLWGTAEDAFADPEPIFDFARTLVVNHVPCELHIFQKGAHGLSLCDQTTGFREEDIENYGNTHKWVELALKWLHQLNRGKAEN